MGELAVAYSCAASLTAWLVASGLRNRRLGWRKDRRRGMESWSAFFGMKCGAIDAAPASVARQENMAQQLAALDAAVGRDIPSTGMAEPAHEPAVAWPEPSEERDFSFAPGASPSQISRR